MIWDCNIGMGYKKFEKQKITNLNLYIPWVSSSTPAELIGISLC
jgi:hypothetical protein